MRGQIAPEVQPIYAGYYIWRGAPNEADLSPKTLREIYPYFIFYLPPRQEVITYPIAGFNDDLRRAIAATISSGIASPTPRSCAK